MRSTVLADTVIQKIYEKYNSLGKEDRKNCIVTVKIKEGDREKYLGEIPEFVDKARICFFSIYKNYQSFFSVHLYISRLEVRNKQAVRFLKKKSPEPTP
jgi:hypothetical protein